MRVGTVVVVDDFLRLGSRGCVGSMDCTHVVWDRAAESQQYVQTQWKSSNSFI